MARIWRRSWEKKSFLSHLWEFLLHRMIPKEQKESVMAVPGDLAEPGKADPALCLLQTLPGLRLWPFRPAGPRAGKHLSLRAGQVAQAHFWE